MLTNDKLKLSRREFILSSLSALVTTASLEGCVSLADSDSQNSISYLLSQTIDDPAAAKKLGTAYLQANPDESGIAQLIKRIDEVLLESCDQLMTDSDPQQLAEHLNELVKKEYRRGEAVLVEGWQLSRTEARLYALITLL